MFEDRHLETLSLAECSALESVIAVISKTVAVFEAGDSSRWRR
jgi:hypothetical protein